MVMMSHFQHCAIYVSMVRGTSLGMDSNDQIIMQFKKKI